MLSAKTKRNVNRIMPYGVIWLVFSLVYTQLERGLLGGLNYYPATGNSYDFLSNLIVTPVTALIAGLLTGVLEVMYFQKRFNKKSFGQKILYKSITYIFLIIFFIVALIVLTTGFQPQRSLFDKDIWGNLASFFEVYAIWSLVIFIAVIVVITQFYSEVSENIGAATLRNFFTGKYHKPLQEERVFMFLDMKSSTSIAELLGHLKYFELLKEYYADFSEAIINASAEVYQYAGDEIILSWKRNHSGNNTCISCFFDLKQALQKKQKKYEQKFGMLPGFKAGIHTGIVTTGEIGTVKKEIFFTGDVLNTSSRIQGLCNSYNVDILLSKELVTLLEEDVKFNVIALGENSLRGRDEKIELFTVESTD